MNRLFLLSQGSSLRGSSLELRNVPKSHDPIVEFLESWSLSAECVWGVSAVRSVNMSKISFIKDRQVMLTADLEEFSTWDSLRLEIQAERPLISNMALKLSTASYSAPVFLRKYDWICCFHFMSISSM